MLRKGDEPIPGYRLQAFLGRGQFGEVWRASSPGGAQVALKFLNLDERQGRKEFGAIQRIKTIRHPHLATVTALWLLDEQGRVLGEAAANSYTTERPARATLIPSGTDILAPDEEPHQLVVATLLCDKNLMDRLAECQAEGLPGIPTDELLRYMEEAAKGIDFLNSQQHDMGDGPVAVQHCDIKPANIMLTGGSVMICDFGVAAFLNNPRLAATGTSMAGSPAYMSPECTQCKPSAASDQYSLAITYFELRTGELPFRGTSWMEVIDAHRSGDLDLSRLSPDEQTVIRKATAVDPAQRYPSTLAMVHALQQAVAPVAQTPPRRASFRTPTGIALILAFLGVCIWNLWAVLAPRNGTATQQSDAKLSVQQVTATLMVVPSDATVLVDGTAVQPDGEGRVTLTRPPDASVDLVVRKQPEYLERREQLSMSELGMQTRVIELARDTDYLRKTAEQLATRAVEMLDADPPHLPNLEQAADEYGRAIELDLARYATVPAPGHRLLESEQEYSFTVRCLALHPTQPWLIARLQGTKIGLWNLASLDTPPTILHEHDSHVCNVLCGGPIVASADLTGQIKVTRLDQSGRPIATVEPPELSGLELALTPDLRWLIAGQYEGDVRGWKLDEEGTDDPAILIGHHVEAVRGIAVTPDSQWAITVGEDGTICRWSIQQPEPDASAAALGSLGGDVFAMAISPEGRWVALGGDAQNGSEYLVSRVDLTQDKLLPLAQGHTTPISALVYDQSGERAGDSAKSALLASGSEDGQVQVYDDETPMLLNSQHTAAIKSLSFCPAPGWLVSGSDDGKVGMWDLHQPGRKPLTLDGDAGRVVQIVVSPQWLIAGYYNGAILLWDLRRCMLLKRAADKQGVELHQDSGRRGAVKT